MEQFETAVRQSVVTAAAHPLPPLPDDLLARMQKWRPSLMRAYARQDQRSLALKIYEEAVCALQQELNVFPSAMTEWLLTRLQRGENI